MLLHEPLFYRDGLTVTDESKKNHDQLYSFVTQRPLSSAVQDYHCDLQAVHFAPCHTGTAPVDTIYLGYSWRYVVLSIERMWDAITEWAPYNRYIGTYSTYRIQVVYIRPEGSLQEVSR